MAAPLKGVGGSSSTPVSRFFRSMDIYRRVPRDLTTSSASGGFMSLIAVSFILFLLISQTLVHFRLSLSTQIVIDHSEDDTFRVNLNVTIPGLSCEFLAVDLKNSIGQNREDIKDKTLHKFAADGTWQGYASRRNVHADHQSSSGSKKSAADINAVESRIPKRDHYGNSRHSYELHAGTFASSVNEWELLLVDFHAPWCIHCRNLAPIWEHAAELVQKKAHEEELRLSTRHASSHGLDAHDRHSLALGSIDCTRSENVQLCRDNHIQGFPTILVYRQGKNRAVGGNAGKHESYTGERSANAISDFAIKAFKEILAGDPELGTGEGTDSTGDGKDDSTVHTKGCRIEGHINVQKVPGQIVIRPHSSGHEFNTGMVNLDHKINHLSFGVRVPQMVMRQRLDRMDGAYAFHEGASVVDAEGSEEVGFVGGKDHMTHEHHVKVVAKTYVPWNGQSMLSYEYTMNSNAYFVKEDGDAEEKKEKKRRVSEFQGIPVVLLHYDLSPLQVIEREERRPWIDAITSLCAIIGGVYTCSVMFEAVFSRVVGTISKKLE